MAGGDPGEGVSEEACGLTPFNFAVCRIVYIAAARSPLEWLPAKSQLPHATDPSDKGIHSKYRDLRQGASQYLKHTSILFPDSVL